MSYWATHRRAVLLFLAAVFLVSGWANDARPQESQPKAPPTVVFMTDFGTMDDSVAICKGVMYSIAPELRIVVTCSPRSAHN